VKRLFPLFLLVCLVLLFFLPVILSSSIWGFRDFHRYVYPIRYFGRTCIIHGIIPFWNPYIGCGTPFFAGLQGCVFYPPSILVYILPFDIGLKAYIIFHFLLSAIGCYFLGLHFKLDKEPSFIIAIVYTFSGWLLSSIDIPIILASSSWMPLIFLFLLRSSFILTGLSLSFQFTAGEPSIFYITSILIFVFSIYIKKIKTGLISLLIGISFSLFQILPFLEFLLHSTRISQGYTESTKWAFSPYEVFKFILPSSCGAIVRGDEQPFLWFGQMWLKSPYLGVIPFILSIIAILYPRKEKIPLFFSYSALISLIASFGSYTPLYKALYPLFFLMRYPVKFLYITSFSLSVLSGFCASYILNKKTNPVKAFVYVGLFISALLIILFLKRDLFFSLFSSISKERLLKWQNMLYSDGIFILLIISFSLIFVLLYISSKIKRNAFIIGFIGLIIIDLFFFGSMLNPLVKKGVYKKSDTVRFLEKKNGLFRICLSPKTSQYFTIIRGKTLTEAIENAKRFVIPNTSILFGIYEAGSYDSLYISSYFSFKKNLANKPFPLILKLLSLMNVRFIISRYPIIEENIRLVYQDKDLLLYENPLFLERAFFVEGYVIKKRPLEYILSPDFAQDMEIVLEEEPQELQIENCKMQNAKCKIIKYEPNKVIIEVDTPSNGFLFLSDTYYPGWKAYVRTQSTEKRTQKETKIYKANYCFRAVKIPKGSYIVEFRYFPKTFIIGLIASLVSCLFIMVYLKTKC